MHLTSIALASPPADLAPGSSGGGLLLILAGLVLCFGGARSILLAAGAAGFGLAGGLAAALGGPVAVTVLVGVAGAAGAIALVRFAAGAAVFVVGGLAGGAAVLGLLAALPSGGGLSRTLTLVVVAAAALVAGLAMARARGVVLRIATALGGAALIVRGAISAGPAFLAGLQAPATPLESIAAVVVLAVLAWTGYRVQVALDRRRTTA
ncbi:hypothetical protein [Pseudonocardia sp. NPDC046786]|uniref:hypothetical protein n=1 Tax=Pseudonocardia sp. NPDC046786 TaxID=3155471 RepID=UPI0033C876B7